MSVKKTNRENRFKPLHLLTLLMAMALILFIAVWIVAALFGSKDGDPEAALPVPITPELIKAGAYAARLGDCTACHTAPGGKLFAGGLAINSPIGDMYTTNITPDKETGIGNYTYGDFERALRRGIAKDGHSLYPAMPFPSFASASDQDVQALYAYFMNEVKPVHQPNKTEGIPWPLSMRWPLVYWRWLFSPEVQTLPAASSDPVIARGAYLVESLGHCGACHTPRALTMQEKAYNNSSNKEYLSGGAVLDDWSVPSIRGEMTTGIGIFSTEELALLLKTGRTDRAATFGGMAQMVHDSSQHMTNQDLTAIASYLKSLAPLHQEDVIKYDPTTYNDLHAGKVTSTGAQLYIDNCMTCHRSKGEGCKQVFPFLAGNPIINDKNPISLIHIVLTGSTMPSTMTTPTQFSMPSFYDRLSDQQVADVVSFIRTSWGNNASAVNASQVLALRKKFQFPVKSEITTDYAPVE